ncbi:MAG: hypothetical protein V3R52_03775 [Candidatus Neomarinimicrobiota bacterium]
MNKAEIEALKYATYYYGAQFGDFSYFFNQIEIDETFSHIEPWLRPSFQENLHRIKSLAETHEIQSVFEYFNNEDAFLKQYHRIILGFSDLFDINEMPSLRLVDNFPDPFSDKGWDAMSVDGQDEEKFSIPKGIYYRKAVLTHCYFEFVIAHEIAHWIVSCNSKKHVPYVTLFEEGLCDLLGAFILIEHSIVPVGTITNLFAYNRALKPQNSLWYAYWTYCKATISIVIEDGFDEIIKIIKSGRENIWKFPIQSGSLNNEDYHAKSNIKNLICALLKADMLYTIPAEEFIVLKTSLQYAEEYVNAGVMAKDLKISPDRLNSILTNLANRGLIVIESDDMIYQPSAILPDNIRYGNL